ncbi:MAG: hypothetical protein IT436_08120 [Phycisphaerales bacterium]|nr:hypothetical protein [Phycisphaerales bacterium]
MGGGASGCACAGEDAAGALGAVRAGPAVVELIDDLHLIVRIRRCRCGRAYLSIFTERIDWANGDDPQHWEFFPLEEAEVARLLARAAEGPVDEAFLLEFGAGMRRRMLVRDWPGGAGEPVVGWRDGPLTIAAHD